jgi:probable phosphoglycerate mutase
MTIFYLIRHAHCAAIGHTIAGLEEGIHLSPQGRLQAMRLAKQLSLKPIGTVCCSPLERAYETAEPIADLLGLRIEISQAWEEIHYGDWTGRAIHELKMDPDWLRFNEFRSGTRIPSGELIIEVQARMVIGLNLLRQNYPDIHIAIISHGDAIRSALAYFAGIPIDFLNRFEIAPASISTLRFHNDGVQIMQVNHTCDSAIL